MVVLNTGSVISASPQYRQESSAVSHIITVQMQPKWHTWQWYDALTNKVSYMTLSQYGHEWCHRWHCCSCITATWWSGSGGIQAWSWWPTGFLQCFDTVGLVIWPVNLIPEMTYNVLSGTLLLCCVVTCIEREICYVNLCSTSNQENCTETSMAYPTISPWSRDIRLAVLAA